MKVKKESSSNKKQAVQVAALLALGVSIGATAGEVVKKPVPTADLEKTTISKDAVKKVVKQPTVKTTKPLTTTVPATKMDGPPRP